MYDKRGGGQLNRHRTYIGKIFLYIYISSYLNTLCIKEAFTIVLHCRYSRPC